MKNHWNSTLKRKQSDDRLESRFLRDDITLTWLLDRADEADALELPEYGALVRDLAVLLRLLRKPHRLFCQR